MSQSSEVARTYRYPRPAVTVDIAVRTTEAVPRLLLIRRKGEPFAGYWALPGGFVEENEPLVEAARRELLEETGVSGVELVELGAFGDPGRDPRGWTISIAWIAEVEYTACRPVAADDAADVGWFPLDGLPTLAFDHAAIVARMDAATKENGR